MGFMKSRTGYTIVEFIVAILVLSLVVVTAISFFIFQSGYGRDVSKKRDVRETVSLALLMIRQDIMHAGLGVADKPQMALNLRSKTGDGSAYQELFVNYGRYLDTRYSPSPNVFANPAYFSISGGGNLTTSLTPYDIGAFLSDSRVIVDYQRPVTVIGPSQYQYTLAAGSAAGNYAPAISYAVQNYALVRNGTDPAGNPQIILGGDPSFRVTGFRLRAMFYSAGEIWSPDGNSAHDFESTSFNLDFKDLRVIEVTIAYQMKEESVWSADFTRSMRVSPRTVVLSTY